jgi:hypothetical protein
MSNVDFGTVTLPLHWEEFDDGISHHRLWTLCAGPFEVGEVYHSSAGWCWQFILYNHNELKSQPGYQSLDDAQAGLVAAVKGIM